MKALIQSHSTLDSTFIGIALVIVGILLYALKKREPYVSRGVIF